MFAISRTILFLKTDHVTQNYLHNLKKFICKRINKDSYVGRVYFLKLLERFQNSFKIITLFYKYQGKVKFYLTSHFQYNTEEKMHSLDVL